MPRTGHGVDTVGMALHGSRTLDASALLAVLGGWLPAVLEREGRWLCVKSADGGRYVHVGAAMGRFVGRHPAELVGATDADIFDATTSSALRAADLTALGQAEMLASEHRIEHQGVRADFAVLRQVVAGPDDQRYLCSVWTDLGPERRRQQQLDAALSQIEQQQQSHGRMERELAERALNELASGLHSRALFEDQLRRELDLSTREHREFALVDIEVDPLSDGLDDDPAAVERVLDAIGRLLRGGTRAMDATARLDGHRFLVLLSGVGLATAHARMETLRRQCATQIVAFNGRELRFTASMGVASFPHTASDREQLLGASQAALAEAQRRGGNHVTLAAIRFDAA